MWHWRALDNGRQEDTPKLQPYGTQCPTSVSVRLNLILPTRRMVTSIGARISFEPFPKTESGTYNCYAGRLNFDTASPASGSTLIFPSNSRPMRSEPVG